MRRRLLGVIGHVDHGKTALVRALTGMETDRLPEEQRRGISIALGFAHFGTGDAEIDLIDMPGHERFVRTMIAGATGIEAVLVVVAANEGIKPQTIEHLDIAALLGITGAVVAISKIDLVAPEIVQRTADETMALLRRLNIAAPAPLPCSALTGDGIHALHDALLAGFAMEHAPEDRGFPYLPIDRAFSLPGHGTIVTGTLRHGAIAVGDELELIPDRTRLRVRGLQVHRTQATRVAPGERVAVNLRGVSAATLGTGQALTAPNLLHPARWLSVELRMANGTPRALRSGEKLRLLFGTNELDARLRLLDGDTLATGSTVAQLHCATPVTLPGRDGFILRTLSPPMTLAGGRVLDPAATRLRRHHAPALARLRALAGETPAETLARELAAAGETGRPLEALASLAGLAPAKAAATLQQLPALILRNRIVIRRQSFLELCERMRGIIAAFPDGTTRDVLDAELRAVSAGVLDEALARLISGQIVRQESGRLHLIRAEQEDSRNRRDAEAVAELATTLRRAGLTPPDARAVFADPAQRRAAENLLRDGTIVRAIDRVQKRELLFHRDAINAAQRLLAPKLAAPPGLLVSEAGALLGISRKYSVPLLEYLDAVQYTKRVADRRRLARHG